GARCAALFPYTTLFRSRVRGIVVAGTGAGRCSGEEERALREAVAAGVRVVMSSRVGTGRVVPLEAYRHLDYVTADNLNPQKARIDRKSTRLNSSHVKIS